MNHVFYRHTRFQPPVAARGDGVYIIDSDGNRYLDASGGAAVSSTTACGASVTSTACRSS